MSALPLKADIQSELQFRLLPVAGRLVLQELCQQLCDFLRLLLLHPMTGALHQMKAHHAGARGLLHALGSARGLIDPQSLLPPMNMDGTSMVRPENVCISAMLLGSEPRRTR